MRTIEETRKRWHILFRDNGTTSDLRRAVNSEQGESICADGLRSVCWEAFLLFNDLDQAQWPQKLSDTRRAYSALRDHFLKYIQHPDDLQSNIDPLADDEESPWQTLRRDEIIRAEISQDVERCMQDNLFFREPSTKAQMVDILFIYAKLNPDLGYRQGMHELLAPVFWVIDRDAIDSSSLEDAIGGEKEMPMVQILDADYVEHDAFTIFCIIMQTARIYYEHSDQRPAANQLELIPIVNRCLHVHKTLLMALDPELGDHLQTIEILPQIFLTRWMRLLFGREFPFDDLLTMWDLLFAVGLQPEIIEFVCVAMILRIRWQLLEADYSAALSLLLHYPSPQPHAPQSFVHDAVYLEQNPTTERGRFIISKYSGRPPETRKATPWNENFSSSRSHLGPFDNNPFPIRSIARNSPKSLETFLQDVSEGLQRRTESWGVAKVVKGAVSEARSHLQAIQPEASVRGPRVAEKSLPNVSLNQISQVGQLKSKLEHLEQRNMVLGKIIKETLDDLQSHMTTADSLEPTTQRAVTQTMEKFRAVQTWLEDSSTPINLLSGQTPLHDSKSRGKYPDTPVVDVRKETRGESKPSNSMPVSSGPLGEPEDGELTTSGIIGSNSVNKINFHSTARASLADSGFSWMLESSRPLSNFVSPASVPPEQSRQTDSIGKPNPLFGDNSEKRPDSKRDDLAMNSLRGQRRQK